MKALVFCILYATVFCHPAAAQYPVVEKAGEMSYATTGPDINYRFFFKMVLDCKESPPIIGPVYIRDLTYDTVKRYNWIYDSSSNKVDVVDPCIAFTSAPCYRVWYYHFDCGLPYNNNGYSAMYLDCCRDYYQNLYTSFNASMYDFADLGMIWGSGDITRPSIVYVTNSIASIINIPSKFKVNINHSPVFDAATDTILYVCKDAPFEHVFKATDGDGDSLSYSFVVPRVFSIAGGPPGAVHIDTAGVTAPVSYFLPYSDKEPLGPGVTLDARTGLMQGELHDTGSYLATIGVFEFRKGQLVTRTPHARDVVIKVFDCSKLPTPVAALPPLVNNCDSNTITLPNLSTPYHPELYWDNNKYMWDLGDGSTSGVRYPKHTYDTGTYNVQLITMPGYRCADTANMKLLIYPSVHPAFVMQGQTCSGQALKFINLSSTDIGYINSLTWTFTNLKDSSSFTSKLSTPTYTFRVPNQTYSAVLDITTNKGCEARDTQYINIRQSPLPLAVHDTVITAGVPYQLYANSGYDTTGSTYVWTPATGLDNLYIANPIATGTQDITYKVQETNMFGCSLSDTVHLTYYKGPDIYLPNAFTPNGDGINDIFRPFPVGIKKLQYFRVFDRWGNILYQTQTYLAGWDGNINGRQAPGGTYIYEARGIDYNSKPIFKKGYVLLLR